MSRKLPRGVYRSGNRYASKVKLPTGKWMCRTFRTTHEAELWFAAAKEALREGRPVPDPRRAGQTGGGQYQTVTELVAAWMEYQYPAPSADGKGGCNPDTKAATAGVARRHVLPRLGHLTLAEVTVQDVDELAKHLHAKLSFDYAEKGCWVLRASLHYAYQRGWVKVNVAALPGRRRRPVPLRPLYLTLAETMRVSACLRPEYRIGLWVQRLCGLRVGELFGLQIEDVDLDNRILVLWKQGGRKSSRADEHAMVDKLKEEREFRHVGIPKCLVRPLRQHIRTHLRDATPTTRLMPSILGGRSYQPYCDSVARAAAQAGIKDAHGRRFRTHWLRAAMLTDLHRAGLNPRDISTVGGHSTKDPAAGSPVTYKYYVLDVGDVQVQLAAAAVIDQRVRSEVGEDICVTTRSGAWVPIAQAAHELGVGVACVREQIGDGKIVARTTRDPGHNVPRTWVHRASLDARLAALEERVSLKAASEVLGVSACTLRSVLAHLEITPNRGQDGLTKARVTKVQLELVRSTLSKESRFTDKHLTLSGAAATLGLTPYRIHRELSSGTLRRARAVPERLRSGVVWITWASVRGHPRYEADRSPDLADGLSVTDAAHRAGVSEATIRRWLQDGSLASVRRGRRVWISAADLDGVLKLRRRTA